MPRPGEDRSNVGGAAQFTNIGPVPLSLSDLSRFPLQRVAREGWAEIKMPRPGEDRSNVGGAAQFTNIGPVPLSAPEWGSCSVEARRIWFNLELAKKPVQCLEYIAVRELIHLLGRHHNDRFTALMDEFLPQWRFSRAELNHAPLAHETWTY